MSKEHCDAHVLVALAEINCELRALREDFRLFTKEPKSRLDLSIGLVELKNTKGQNNMTTIHLTNEQQIVVTLSPKTAKGKPAKIDGVPVWTVQSGDSTVQPADDGLSATLVSADTDGDTVILVEADADMGSGFQALDAGITVVVTEPQAADLGLTVGEPTDKPTAPAIAPAARATKK